MFYDGLFFCRVPSQWMSIYCALKYPILDCRGHSDGQAQSRLLWTTIHPRRHEVPAFTVLLFFSAMPVLLMAFCGSLVDLNATRIKQFFGYFCVAALTCKGQKLLEMAFDSLHSWSLLHFPFPSEPVSLCF